LGTEDSKTKAVTAETVVIKIRVVTVVTHTKGVVILRIQVIKDIMHHLEAITVAAAEVVTVALMEATEIIVEIKQATR